ncbi:MAG: hypothetical protein AABX52_00590 [Nanoarchaeota archaeon]
MRIAPILLFLCVVSSVFAAKAPGYTPAVGGWKGVKGAVELTGSKVLQQRQIPKEAGPRVYASIRGFKGANTGPKGIFEVNLTKSKIDKEREISKEIKKQAAKAPKYQYLIDLNKRGNSSTFKNKKHR